MQVPPHQAPALKTAEYQALKKEVALLATLLGNEYMSPDEPIAVLIISLRQKLELDPETELAERPEALREDPQDPVTMKYCMLQAELRRALFECTGSASQPSDGDDLLDRFHEFIAIRKGFN